MQRAQTREPIIKEDKAIIIDFLPNGYPTDSRPSHRKTAIALAIGVTHLTLLELVPKPNIQLQTHDEVYIGEGKREQIHHVNGNIDYDKLTSSAKIELEFMLKKVINDNPERFITFFNKAGPVSIRLHSLELIPGLGKKHARELLDERKEEPFKSFEDIKARVKLMPDPQKSIMRRIMSEYQNEDKYKLFVGR